ncbi:olfactory receptor 11H6-like [Crotalus tigris]|uniref:olfactory receptor 11H6-like n=1 Tax=Crotalus tigris TaxID=88082 RepID=UPI00192F4428|nr:olfactory receptor 11H6-like [Crotalus tigris]
MELVNKSKVQEFVLVGFGGQKQIHHLLIIIFVVLYILTLTENVVIIMLVFLDSHLARLPMYIFLSNFSWLEMAYVSTTMPRMLYDLVTSKGNISFQACFLQFYIFFSLGSTECFFLSAMALDRYLAICCPLRYLQVMSQTICSALVATCWILGFLWYIVPVILMSRLSYCGSNIIDHLLCDPGPILSLACPPLGKVPFICQVFMNTVFAVNLIFVVLSYSMVILTLMQKSRKGSRRKSFSTIVFHLVLVTLFYGSVAGVYLTPGGESQSDVTKLATIFYTTITPFLNPFIYCLRNDQVKEALGRLLKRKGRFM